MNTNESAKPDGLAPDPLHVVHEAFESLPGSKSSETARHLADFIPAKTVDLEIAAEFFHEVVVVDADKAPEKLSIEQMEELNCLLTYGTSTPPPSSHFSSVFDAIDWIAGMMPARCREELFEPHFEDIKGDYLRRRLESNGVMPHWEGACFAAHAIIAIVDSFWRWLLKPLMPAIENIRRRFGR